MTYDIDIKQYKDNFFLNAHRTEFFKLYVIMKSHESQHLSLIEEDQQLYELIKNTYPNAKDDITIDDMILMIFNNIDHLPDCKCKMKGKKINLQ